MWRGICRCVKNERWPEAFKILERMDPIFVKLEQTVYRNQAYLCNLVLRLHLHEVQEASVLLSRLGEDGSFLMSEQVCVRRG